jgi:hypothetical protein
LDFHLPADAAFSSRRQQSTAFRIPSTEQGRVFVSGALGFHRFLGFALLLGVEFADVLGVFGFDLGFGG